MSRYRHRRGYNPRPNYDAMTDKELVQLARDKGINASSHWKRETIINKLKEL